MNNWLISSLCIGVTLISQAANGQITPDSSLSTEVNQRGNTAEITGGSQAGSNLFHSFQDFSLPGGNVAWFNNATEIDNILSRVTGGNISDINGLIRANGTANLFLINPAGVVFGENARLQIGGSFFGSSATGITFGDGTVFSANDINTPSLTINAPIGLDLRNTAGNISSRGNLTSDRNLSLSGNNLALQGQLAAGENLTLVANNSLTVRDGIDQPLILEAGQELSLQGELIDIFALNNFDSGLFSGGDLTLRSDNPINGDAHYVSGGSFRVEKLDGTLGNLISLKDPVIRSQGDVSLAGYTGASLHIQSGGNVTIDGDITITGIDTTENSIQETITLSNDGQLDIDGNAQPTLDVRAGKNNVSSLVSEESPIQSGSNININGRVNNPGGQVFLTNQDQPNPDLTGGDITVTEIDTSNSLGNGGDVTIDSRNDINIPDGIDTSSVVDAQLTTEANLTTFPQIDITAGNGGAIALLAQNNITIGDLNPFSRVDLNLNTVVDTIDEANNIFAIPQANVTAGAGGKINLRAGNNINLANANSSSEIAITSESIALDNFSIITALLELNTANGGEINLDAGNNLTTGNLNSRVAVSDRLTSNAETTPNITLSVSQIGLTISQADIGSGGDIFLQAGSQINTGSLDSSVSITNIADNLAVVFANDPQTATAENPSRVNSQIDLAYENTNIGRGGEITLNSDRATVDQINTSLNVTSENTVFAEANAENDAAADSVAISDHNLAVTGDRPGNITFNVAEGVNFNNLAAGAIANNGINNLDSVAFSDSDQAIATADADGTNIITFDSQTNLGLITFSFLLPDVDLVIDSVNNLPHDFLQPPNFNTCPVNAKSVNPEIQAIETAQGKIYPAGDIIVEDGQIRLIAKQSSVDKERHPIQFSSCN